MATAVLVGGIVLLVISVPIAGIFVCRYLPRGKRTSREDHQSNWKKFVKKTHKRYLTCAKDYSNRVRVSTAHWAGADDVTPRTWSGSGRIAAIRGVARASVPSMLCQTLLCCRDICHDDWTMGFVNYIGELLRDLAHLLLQWLPRWSSLRTALFSVVYWDHGAFSHFTRWILCFLQQDFAHNGGLILFCLLLRGTLQFLGDQMNFMIGHFFWSKSIASRKVKALMGILRRLRSFWINTVILQFLRSSSTIRVRAFYCWYGRYALTTLAFITSWVV